MNELQHILMRRKHFPGSSVPNNNMVWRFRKGPYRFQLEHLKGKTTDDFMIHDIWISLLREPDDDNGELKQMRIAHHVLDKTTTPEEVVKLIHKAMIKAATSTAALP